MLKPAAARWDQSRTCAVDNPKHTLAIALTADPKVAYLRVYRHARGLCQYCAEKWSKCHKCADTVQLHAIQELWDMMSIDQPESEGEFEDSVEQLMLLLSTEVASANTPSKAFRIRGQLQGMDMLMLLDSGSSHSFLNSVCTTDLLGFVSMDTPLSVKVANGNVLLCLVELPNAEWSVQGITFSSTF